MRCTISINTTICNCMDVWLSLITVTLKELSNLGSEKVSSIVRTLYSAYYALRKDRFGNFKFIYILIGHFFS